MSNKQSAAGFLQMVCERKIREAYDKYIAPNFIHHNQYFPGDRESLLHAMEEAHGQFPETSINIKMVLEEGDKVMTFSHVKHTPESLGIVVGHIFRFVDGKAVELWDFGQQVEDDSPNENGPF